MENEQIKIIGESEFGFGPMQADGADEEAKAVLLMGEDVLDLGPDGRFSGIGLCGCARHRTSNRRFIGEDDTQDDPTPTDPEPPGEPDPVAP